MTTEIAWCSAEGGDIEGGNGVRIFRWKKSERPSGQYCSSQI